MACSSRYVSMTSPHPRRQCSDQISNDFDMIGKVTRDFQPGELLFDQYHQLKTIEPVGSEIFCEVRFISDPLDIDI